MGGDGGVKASQRKFIRGTKSNGSGEEQAGEELKNARKKIQRMRTRLCTQSDELLEEPIVCCEMGNLYKKEAILSALLNKSVTPSCLHVRGLKDLKQLIFSPNPTYSADQEVDGEYPPMFMCPITKQEFNGHQPFVIIWSTGYVLSERALKQLGVDALQTEYGPFTADDVIRLNPIDEEEIDDLRRRMIARRARTKASKEEKRKLKDLSTAGSKDPPSSDAMVSADQRKKHKTEKKAATQEEVGSSDAVPTKLSKHGGVVRSAVAAVAEQSNSKVFKDLFHKDKEKDKHDRDLFMSVAGLRYTVG